jgi:hypothetical protein
MELSTTIAKVGLIISSVFLVIIGLINNNRIPNNDRKRNKAKTNSILICFGFIKNIDKMTNLLQLQLIVELICVYLSFTFILN